MGDSNNETAAGVSPAMPPRHLVVLAAPRTGTTMLRALLGQDSRILSLGELLNPRPGAQHATLGFWATRRRSGDFVLDAGVDPKARLQLFRDYFIGLEASQPGRILLTDIKYDQVGAADTVWRMPDHAPAPLTALLERRARVMHVTRRNRLAQLASLHLALRDDNWVARGSEAKSNPRGTAKLTLDAATVLDRLRRIDLRVKIAEHWLGNYPNVLDLQYEDILVGDRLSLSTQEKIEELLGTRLTIKGPPATLKIAPPLAELIENFNEVAEALRGSPYEACLEEDPRPTRLKAYAASSARTQHLQKRTVLIGIEANVDVRLLMAIGEVVEPLRRNGLEPVWAVGDVRRAALALGPDAKIMQAPVWPPHRHFGSSSGVASYADVLTRMGFGDQKKLEAMVAAWDALLSLIGPDFIVACASPALHLAVFGGATPVTACGTAYHMPPLDYGEFPPLRGDYPPAVPESRLLRVARQVQTARARPRPASLPSLFHAQTRYVFGLAELDPYRSFRKEPLVAPVSGLPEAMPWFSERRLFVEVDVPRIETLVEAISGLDVTIEACLLGEAGPYPDFLRERGHIVHDRPPPLDKIMRGASHVLATSTPLLSAAAVCAGRAQLAVPNDDESWYVSHELIRHNVGQRLDAQADADGLREQIERFLADDRSSENAKEWGGRLAARSKAEVAGPLFSAVPETVA